MSGSPNATRKPRVNDGPVVADASAILALLKQEPTELIDPRRLFGATVSAVNLSEIIERLCAGGLEAEEADAAIGRLNLAIADFTHLSARAAARLRAASRRVGLSLGDRACLALGRELHAPVVTADRAWAGLDIGVEVILIR